MVNAAYLAALIKRNPLLRDGDYDLYPTQRHKQHLWLREAIGALRARGLDLDRVLYVDSATNEERRPEQPRVLWQGLARDAQGRRVPYTLIWHSDPAKFARVPHYYVLDTVQLGDPLP